MSLPRRFEQVGIVVGSVLMMSLPVGFLLTFFPSGPGLLDNLLMYVPGLVIGVLVALRKFPASYGQVWLFGIVSWLATILLWGVLEVGSVAENRSIALGAWTVALLVGAVTAWAKPRIQWRWSEA